MTPTILQGTAQATALKADIAANTSTVLINGQPTAINAVPDSPDNDAVIAAWYNQAASPAYWVVRTDADCVQIGNAVAWASYTPNPAVSSTNAAQGTQAALYAQCKQMNLAALIQRPNQTTFDATKAKNTAGLQDALQGLPTGASFAAKDAGWANVAPILQRTCTFAEKLYVQATNVSALTDGTSARGTQYNGTAGNPDVMGEQGALTAAEVHAALSS